MHRGRRAGHFTYPACYDLMSAAQDMSYGVELPNVAVYVALGAWVAQGSYSSLHCKCVGAKIVAF